MEAESCVNGEKKVLLVDYKNNKSLLKHGIEYHWWNSESTSLHHHNFYEFFIVTSGEAVHEINGVKRNLHRGRLEIIHPDDEHRIVSSCVKKSAHINISVTEQKLKMICEAVDMSFDALVGGDTPTITLSVDEMDSIIEKAEKIGLMTFNSDQRRHVLISELLLDVMYIVYKRSLDTESDVPSEFNDILEKIHSPAYYDCTAHDVYSLAGFSAPMVIAMFKKYTGKTVVEYLRCVKMGKACELLSGTNTSLVEISNLLGYASLSHFNSVFKKHAGLTPAAYRKLKRGTI